MLQDIPSLLPELREFYEDLHRHPELSFAEVRTSGIMAQRLSDLGFEVTTGVGRTGVVATLDNGAGHTVLLRADIDALPVKEATGLSYASTATGIDSDGAEVPVAHACGHDMHATWLIGAATQLVKHRDAWQGKVILAVQPAEEIGGGATAMIDDGLFERFGTPDVALGQHVTPAPAGWVLFRPGPVMTASDALKIVMHGRGAHGSAPEQSVDPVVMAASTIMKLQTVVSRNIAATDSAVVTVGTMRAGTKENIISDHAELTLSVRTFESSVREKVLSAISRIARGEADACGAEQPPRHHDALQLSGGHQRCRDHRKGRGGLRRALRRRSGHGRPRCHCQRGLRPVRFARRLPVDVLVHRRRRSGRVEPGVPRQPPQRRRPVQPFSALRPDPRPHHHHRNRGHACRRDVLAGAQPPRLTVRIAVSGGHGSRRCESERLEGSAAPTSGGRGIRTHDESHPS